MIMRRLRKCQSPLQADKIILLVGIFVLMTIWAGLSGCGTTGATQVPVSASGGQDHSPGGYIRAYVHLVGAERLRDDGGNSRDRQG